MKRKTKTLILILIFSIPAFFLTGCGDLDWDLMEIAFEAWAEENGLYVDGEYKPEGVVRTAVEDTLSDITNSEESVQLDGVDVIREIEKADAMADQAIVGLDSGMMASAVAIRPHDWTLHEKDAAVWFANGNAAAAQSAYDKSDQLLLDSIGSGGSCITMRINQLLARADALQQAGMECPRYPNCSLADIREEHGRIITQAVKISETNSSPFCGD